MFLCTGVSLTIFSFRSLSDKNLWLDKVFTGVGDGDLLEGDKSDELEEI